MYPDEKRSETHLIRQIIQESTSDPEKFWIKYQGLVARDRKAKQKIAKLEGSLNTIKRENNQLRKRAKNAEHATKELEVKLATAQTTIQKYRELSNDLKSTLKALRTSRTMKVGRVLSEPYRLLGKGVKSARELFANLGTALFSKQYVSESKQIENLNQTTPLIENQSSKISPINQIESANTKSKSSHKDINSQVSSTEKRSLEKADQNLPVSQRSLERLRQDFEEDPSPVTLSRVTSREWYVHGLIDEPAKRLEANAELFDAMKERDKWGAIRVLGASRAKCNATQWIPAKTSSPAYTVEPGRVLYCVHSTPAFQSNGYSTRTQGVATGLKEAGSDVVVLARIGYPWDSRVDGSKPTEERTVVSIDEIDYVHCPGANLNRDAIDHYIMTCADLIVREARRIRPAIIQAASNHVTALPALIAARRLGIPFIYEVRGFWELTGSSTIENWGKCERFILDKQLEILVSNRADSVLAITNQVAEELVSRGVDRDRITVAPNAVDTNYFLPLPKDETYKKALGLKPEVPVIGFAGSIVSYEGLDDLLRASKQLSDQEIEHCVVIAGSGAVEANLKKLAEELELSTVKFVGRLPRADMPRLFSIFDIVACPRKSLVVTELVSPLKPLESFGTGTATVLSDVTPNLDLAGPQDAGKQRALVFSSGDIDGLANTLVRLLENPDLRRELGRRSRLWTLDERTWSSIGGKMRDAHQSAIEQLHNDCQGKQKELAGIRLGLIADEFTTSTLSANVDVVVIDRESWKKQLATKAIDVLFVESAWSGNQGQWHRGVGYYSEQESKDLFELLDYCSESNIPTVFWNKEDPVHFARFAETAKRFDHIASTDSRMLLKYLKLPECRAKSAQAIPFFADPHIHNPLPPKGAFKDTVAYAGSYYGDRYKYRSRQLYRMLTALKDYGLTIYDRQFDNPDSPYEFPPEFRQFVAGSLPYREVIDSYKTHLAHINVNSVADSPTMFSRRVVEIGACGGLVLSGPGQGIQDTLGDGIFTSNEYSVWRAFVYDWRTNENARREESWRQFRTIYRSYLAHHVLAIILRSAGIPVKCECLPDFVAELDGDDEATVSSLRQQSVLPSAVIVSGDPKLAQEKFRGTSTQIVIAGSSEVRKITKALEWRVEITEPLPRTALEDALYAICFGEWDRIDWKIESDASKRLSIFDDGLAIDGKFTLHRINLSTERLALQELSDVQRVAVLATPTIVENERSLLDISGDDQHREPHTILFAGHDLKFAGSLIKYLEDSGHKVLIDQWKGHNAHNEDESTSLLEQADVIFCEWGLGNLVWYSHRVREGQRLVCRVHSQELFLPYLRQAAHANVDRYIFVGELIRQSAVQSHGVPLGKTLIIPNMVNVSELHQEKTAGAEFNIGFVGIIPAKKRLDLALDVLEQLLEQDNRYRLFIKGKTAKDFPWMANRPDELAYYQKQDDRIARINRNYPDAVVFDGYDTNMVDWYKKIGTVLSTSEFESFHLTIADGAASGAIPVSLAWPGADLIYPRDWLVEDTRTMVHRISNAKRDSSRLLELKAIIENRFDKRTVLKRLGAEIIP